MLRGNWLILVGIIILLFGINLGLPTVNSLTVVDGQLHLPDATDVFSVPAKLRGEWKFYPNQLLEPADYPGTEERLSVNIPVPSSWGDVLAESQNRGDGFGTYALEINRHGNDAANGLLLQPICGASKIYFFDPAQANAPTKAIAGLGTVASTASGTSFWKAPQLVSLPQPASDKQVLIIQVSNYTHHIGGLCQDVVLGSLDGLYAYQNQKLLFEGGVIAVIFSIALYAFGMYFHYHANPANFWLGILASTATLFFWTRANLWEIGLGGFVSIYHGFHYKLEYITMLLLGPFGVNYYRFTFKSLHIPRPVLHANAAAAGLIAALILLTTTRWFSNNLWLLLSFTGIQVALVLYILIRAVMDKKPESAMFMISILPILITIPLDFSIRMEVLQGEYMSQYACLFFMFMHCLIQSRRLSNTIDYTARISQTLAFEVEKQTESLEEKNRQLLMVHKELQRANRELQALSVTDGLTGTNNRLYFDRQYQVEWQRSRREQEPFSLILLDIDHFKQVNDQYGHMAGDQCLKTVAGWLKLIFKRSNDVVCRYGGEEFAILLPNTVPAQAVVAAEQIRRLVADTPVIYLDQEIYLSISAGVSGTVPQKEMQASDLLRAADNALYSVKRNGRNGVHMNSLSPDPEQA